MTPLLLHTLGNRDLQFSKEDDLPGWLVSDYLQENGEDNRFFVLKKEGGEKGANFRELSMSLKYKLDTRDELERLKEKIKFPMLEAALDFTLSKLGGKPVGRLEIIATYQPTPFKYDTDIVGELAKPILEKRYVETGKVGEIFVNYLNIAPTLEGKKEILKRIHQLMIERKRKHWPIFISNQQGLPDTSAALNFLGFFQGYRYLSIHVEEGVQEIDMSLSEDILKELIDASPFFNMVPT